MNDSSNEKIDQEDDLFLISIFHFQVFHFHFHLYSTSAPAIVSQMHFCQIFPRHTKTIQIQMQKVEATKTKKESRLCQN